MKSSAINQLVILLSNDQPAGQIRASRELKRLAETKSRFNGDQLRVIFDSLMELKHWESRLHICQMLSHLRIPRESAARVVCFLEQCLSEKNRFVRAWAYNGFYELARQHPEYREYFSEQLEVGKRETSAAVRARIRNIENAMSSWRG